MSRTYLKGFCLLLGVFLLSSLALAQSDKARISGVVTDETGGVIPGVEVLVHNVERGLDRTTITNQAGRYVAAELAPGSYEVTVTMPGFDTLVRRGITLTVAQEAVIDVTLRVGEISQQVVVTGAAPLVNTTTAGLSELVDTRRINELPLNGRDFSSLTLVNPGAFSIRNAATDNPNKGYGTRVSLSGSRPMWTGWLLDGTVVNSVGNFGTPGSASNIVMGVEAVREFRVITGGGYSAEYGAFSGGVVQMVTKSGENAFHGSVYAFHRNDNLDARNFFESERSEFRRNQFGASIGGPIKRDKAFFFFNYEGLRQARPGDIRIDQVPDANIHQGILPDGSQVEIAASIKPYLDLWPLPNGREFGDGVGERLTPTNRVVDQNFFVTRVDFNINDTQNLFGRYTHDNGDDINPASLNVSSTLNASRFRYFTLQYENVVSPTFLASSKASFNRSEISPTIQLNINYPETLFFVGNPFPPNFTYGGVDTFGLDRRPGYRINNLFHWAQSFNHTRGNHSLKFGVSARRTVMHLSGPAAGAFGSFSWNSAEEFLTDQIMDDFVVEAPGSSTIRSLRATSVGMYFQDDWKLRPNLSLNMGIRYEPWTGPDEKFGRMSVIRNWVTATQFDTPETSNTTRMFNSPGEEAFSPRVGLAWDVNGDGKTAVRAGIGIFPIILGMNYYHTVARKNPPFAAFLDEENATNFAGAADLAIELSPSLLTTDLTPRTFSEFIQYEMDPMYETKFNFSIERQLTQDLSATLGYIGGRGRHLTLKADCNARPPIMVNGRPFVVDGTPRVNTNNGVSTCTYTDGESFYNAMSAQLKKRFSSDFQLQASYTWSKTIDDGTTGLGNSDFGEGVLTQPFNTKADRALSSLHVGHNLVVNGLWALPSPAGGGLASGILGGWQISGIMTTATGSPVRLEMRGRTAEDGSRSSSNQHPELVPGRSHESITTGTTAGCSFARGTSVAPQALGTPDLWYDPCAFSLPPDHPDGIAGGFYGNAGRNILRGPGFTNFDLSLQKTFPLPMSESSQLQFRAEFYNILNHANFGLPRDRVLRNDGRLESGAGRITRTVSAERQIQFGLKVLF